MQFAYHPLNDSAVAVGEEVPTSRELVIGEQSIQMYEVTFYTTDVALGKQFGWDYDGAEHRYYHSQEMKYGADIDLGGKHHTVTGVTQFELAASPISDGGRVGEWQGTPEITGDGAKFKATYPAIITYQSEVQFTIEGYEATSADGIWSYTTQFNATDYKLLTPTSDGYTFLGWYFKDENGWRQITQLNASEVSTITVEALWASRMYDFTMSGERINHGKIFSPQYEYTISIGETSEILVGAFANDEETTKNRSVQHEFYIGTNTPKYEVNNEIVNNKITYSKDLGRTGSGVKAYVKVTVTYTDKNGNTLYVYTKEKNGSYNLLGNL